MMRHPITLLGWFVLLAPAVEALAGELPQTTDVARQPLAAQAQRVAEALEWLGRPLSNAEIERLEQAKAADTEAKGVQIIQDVLDPHCLIGVTINAESRVKAQTGPAQPRLMQRGWRTFLVKVHNQAGVTAPLRIESPNAQPIYKRSTGSPDPEPAIDPDDIPNRWMDVAMFNDRPLNPSLSGLEVEYRIIQIHSRDQGPREAKLRFDVGQGTQDLGFRSDVNILFRAEPATEETKF